MELTFFDVAHTEIVPLGKTEGIEIEVEKEVVFEFGKLLDLPQVARLEPRIEEDGGVADVTEVDGVVFELVLAVLGELMHC